MPVTAAARELSVTYNSVTINPHGYTFEELSKDRAAFSCDFIVVGSSEAAFKAACDAVETAFSAPFRDLTVTLGSQTLLSASQSGNTGLDPIATITKPGGPPDSGRSTRYRLRVEFGRPATWATISGLRDSHVVVSKSPAGRALVTLRGTFTATTALGDAKAAHDAGIGTFASDTKTWLGITTWELVEERTLDVSVNRKTADFERVYQELFASQAADSVVRQRLVVTRSRRGSEFSPQSDFQSGAPGGTSDAPSDLSVQVVPLTDFSATYEAWVDKAVTTDLPGLWASIETFVLAQIKADLGVSAIALLGSAPSYDEDDNRITAVVTGTCRDADSTDIIQNVLEQTVRTQPGYEGLPVWDGNPESAIVYRTQQVRTRTTTRRWRVLAAVTDSGDSAAGWNPGGRFSPMVVRDQPGATPIADASGATWFPVDVMDPPSKRPLRIGRPPFTIDMTEYSFTRVERAWVPVA